MAGTQRLWFLLVCSSLWFFRRSSRTGVEASTSVLNPEALPEMVSRVQLYSTPSGYSYYMHLENQMNPPLSSLLSSSTESYPFKILVDTGTAFYVLKWFKFLRKDVLHQTLDKNQHFLLTEAQHIFPILSSQHPHWPSLVCYQ